MKSNVIRAFAVLLACSVLALTGCKGSKEEDRAAGDKPESGFASKTPDAGQPVDHTEMLAQMEGRLKQNPKDWQTLVDLANAHFGLKQFNKSIEYYKRAIEINPDDISSYNELGLAHHYTGQSADGIKYVDEGIKRSPYFQRIWLTKGFILAYGTGDLDNAKTAWEKARALDPESQIGKAAAEYLTLFEPGQAASPAEAAKAGR